MKLSIRATGAFLALPGVVAGVLPIIIGRGSGVGRFQLLSLVPLLVGFGLLVWCVRDFFVAGHGTLAPWDPPKHLVVVGLYRFVRNPMYLAVLTIVSGWNLYFGSMALVWYLIFFAALFHLRVVLFEEPWLNRQFGPDWKEYARVTPRWIPKFRRRPRD